MQVYPEGTIYCEFVPRDVRTIVSEHLEQGQVVEHLRHDPFAAVQWNDEIDS
jgi:(2Fe-2S) ferredoxin